MPSEYERKFTNKEREAIRSFKGEWTWLPMFYGHQALKESFREATGAGLGFESQWLECDMSPLNLEMARFTKKHVCFWMEKEGKNGRLRRATQMSTIWAVAPRKPDASGHQDASSQDDPTPPEAGPVLPNRT